MAAGIHFSTSDGSVYFIRDEILSACKLEGEELEGAEKDLAAEHTAIITDSVAIDRDMPPLEFSAVGGGDGDDELMTVKSTIMCCW